MVRGEFCYQLVKEEKTWLEANSKCQSYGSHLATINSQDENDFIFSKFPLTLALKDIIFSNQGIEFRINIFTFKLQFKIIFT